MKNKYPNCYLHVEECRSGEAFIVPLAKDDCLNLNVQVRKWVEKEFGGELRVSGKLMPKLDGDYYAKIMTDGRSPDSVVCWDGGGFYLELSE